jgi:glutamine amidotransferase
MKIINFPFCNFYSFQRYLRERSISFSILSETNPPKDLNEFIVIPGVGTFGQAMEYLEQKNLVSLIKSHSEKGGNILGICLGMQLLFESSSESPGVKGLGIIKGECLPIKKCKNFQVPHIGWNEIKASKNYTFFQNIINVNLESIIDFYFVHSYVAYPKNDDIITATFEYPLNQLCASVKFKNVLGFQFHPEKSGIGGYKLLDNVLKI